MAVFQVFVDVPPGLTYQVTLTGTWYSDSALSQAVSFPNSITVPTWYHIDSGSLPASVTVSCTWNGVELIGTTVTSHALFSASVPQATFAPMPTVTQIAEHLGAYVSAGKQGYNVLSPPGGATYAAIADGTAHPLSERFASLAAAQAVFPRATALTELIDRHVIQYALDTASWVIIPDAPASGTYVVDNRVCTVTTQNVAGDGTTTTITAPGHGYTAADVAIGGVGAVVQIAGFATSAINGPKALTAVTSTTISFLSSYNGTATDSGTISLLSCLYCRAADSGTVYANAGESAVGLGYQRVEMGPNAVLQKAASSSAVNGNSSAVLATGNARTTGLGTWTPALASTPVCNSMEFPKVTIDGNQANTSVFGNRPGFWLLNCADLYMGDIEAYNAAGDGVFHDGVVDSWSALVQHWGRIYCHSNGLRGLRNSQRSRHITYLDIICNSNGVLATSNAQGGAQGDGFYFDHSMGTLVSYEGCFNKGNGLYIHNVYGESVGRVRTFGNGLHGIYAEAMVASHGGDWLSSNNGQACVLTAPVSGNYTLSTNGYTTANIAFNANAAAIQSALNTALGGSAITASVIGTGPFYITLSGLLVSQSTLITVASGTATMATYDDVRFTSVTAGDGYGVTDSTTVGSITCGYNADYFNDFLPKIPQGAGYALVVEDGIGSLHLPSVRFLGNEASGQFKVPTATTTVGADGQVFAFTPDTAKVNTLSVATSKTDIGNQNGPTAFFTKTFPSNLLRAGSAFRLKLGGTIDNKATSGTITLTVSLGSVTLYTVGFSSGSLQTGMPYWIDLEIVMYGSGASATVVASSFYRQSTSSIAGAFLNTGTVDTTTALTLQATVTFATADTANILHSYVADLTQLQT